MICITLYFYFLRHFYFIVSDTIATFPEGIPDSYVNASVLTHIKSKINGLSYKQYNMALSILDNAAATIYNAIELRGVADNTYIIFASDNGGCPEAGGRNYPLRGTKGSLFEGGVRTEAFIYHPLKASGSFNHIFHVTDWFPTLMTIAGASFKPEEGYELDGLSQFDSIFNDQDPVRCE